MTGSLPQDGAARKAAPLAEGLLWYFPNALAAVAAVSKAGNDQHNPGEPMHHARGKSMDHADCIMRHLVDAGTIDTDGQRHTAKVAWRALALLQEEIERDEGAPLPRNARVDVPVAKAHSCELLAECAREAQVMGLYADACIPEKTPSNSGLDAAATGKPPLEPSRIATPGELSYLASCGPKWSPQWLADQGVPADPRKIARFHKDGSRIATEAEIAGLRELLTAEQLREYGIGDVETATLRDIADSFTDSHGCRITRRHPMHAEALRVADERTPEDLL